MTKITYRDAKPEESGLVLDFIRELADYEKLLHEVRATEEDIKKTVFGEDAKAFCVFADVDAVTVGFALCFYNYSTFQGKPGIYIEDLYVREEYRGSGIGKGFFNYLAQKAMAEDCGRIQWWVLNWNEPSIKFYESLGAKAMKEWTVFRLEGDAIKNLTLG